MKSPYYLLTLFFFALSVSGCDKSYDETCSELNPKYLQLDQLCFSLSDEAKNDDKVYIVNSEADLKANLLLKTNAEGCDDFNDLYDTDFSKYTLIIGQKKVSGIVASMVEQSIKKNCEKNVVTYAATVKNGSYAAVGVYIFAVRISKQPNSTTYVQDISVID